MDNDRTTMMGDAAPALSAETCPACNTEIPAGDDFCPKCGYQRGTWKATAAASTNGTVPMAERIATSGASTSTGPALWSLDMDGGGSYDLSAGRHIVGRGEVDVRLDDGYASRQHAQLDVLTDSVTLTDLGSSNGTFVGDERLQPNTPVELGGRDSFRVANTTLTLRKLESDAGVGSDSSDVTVVAEQGDTAEQVGSSTMDESMNAAAVDAEGTKIDPDSQVDPDKEGHTPKMDSESHWELQPDSGEPLRIRLGETTLGRKGDLCAIVVEGDSYVSGCHCRIIATEHTLEVTDLRSTNGTFVNDARLEPEQPWQLASGDSLRLGQSSFAVVNNKPAITPGQERTQEDQLPG